MLIAFWEQIDEVMILGDRDDNDFMEEDVLLITEKESTEIQGQLQPDKSEEIKNKIQEIERQGGKICHCVKYKFQVEGGDNLKRRSRRNQIIKSVLYYLMDFRGDKVWVKAEELQNKRLILDYWEGKFEKNDVVAIEDSLPGTTLSSQKQRR